MKALFFIILLVVLGYAGIFAYVMIRYKNWKAMSTIAFTIFLLYGSIIGTFIVFSLYFEQTGLVAYAFSIVLPTVYWLWKLYRLTKERPKVNFGALIAFIAYMVAVMFVTTYMRRSGSNNRIQMELFNWAQEDALESFRHIFLNIAMFVPLGAMFPFLTDGRPGHVISGTLFGFLFSALIETGQLLTSAGTCDIDDILANGLGAFLGSMIIAIVLWQSKRHSGETDQ